MSADPYGSVNSIILLRQSRALFFLTPYRSKIGERSISSVQSEDSDNYDFILCIKKRSTGKFG